MVTTVATKAPGRPFPLAARARALGVILAQEFGVPFQLYDASGNEVPLPEGTAGRPSLPRLPTDTVSRAAGKGQCSAACLGDGRYQLLLVLFDAQGTPLVAQGVLPGVAGPGTDGGPEQERLQRWLQAVSDRIRLTEQLAAARHAEEEQSAQAARAWGAVLAVDESVRQVRIHRDPERALLRLLRAVQPLLGVQAVAWVPEQGPEPPLLQGEPVLAPADWRRLAALLARHCPDSHTDRLVLWNHEQAQLWSSSLPAVVNVLAVSVFDHHHLGWVIALNKSAGPRGPAPFRRADAAALLPFASLLELQLRGSRRYLDLRQLLVGLTRALTAAIDAKDAYTFGHSERVARIGVELGRQLGLPGDDLSDVYLAGLLHDIGKIGIRDAVLLKAAPLTPEEFEHIKEHVIIGHRILSDLGGLRNLLPGVRSHHERFDGQGYPDGLAGEAIPLLARILAVADSYDAMSTKRPYRDGMTCAEVEQRLSAGAGTQWDGRVIEAFLRCRQKVHLIRQQGVGDSLNQALAIALRKGDSAQSVLAPAP
jgi:HD-GYP domain-containing protein (c-di-GMP phosphodiesterase class II)